MLQFTSWSWLKRHHQIELSEAQQLIYKLEKATNFRWIAHHLGKRSDITLSSKDLVSSDIQTDISRIGQFAEVACGLYDPNLIWRYLDDLSKPDYPFELHDALRDATLLAVLHGRFSDVQAILAYRQKEKQLVIAFSGTFNISQVLHDINAFRTKYSPCRKARLDAVKVHAGFWRLYRGIRHLALQALLDRILPHAEKQLDVKEIVVTGHSLGGALSLLFMMDLLNPDFCSKHLRGNEIIPPGLSLYLVLFGSPRVGNPAFADLYRSSIARFREARGNKAFREYSVKAYNDGVPALPGLAFAYRHTSTSVLFLHHGCLYHTPPSECECSNFDVIHDEEEYGSSPPPFPLGGHNYYSGRDLERTARRMDWVVGSRKNLDEGWQERYMERMEKERRRLERIRGNNRALRKKEELDGNNSQH